MSFTLKVEFRGLCLLVNDAGNKVVGVLMPDCRKTVDPVHEDSTTGVHHVGYLRYDLADLDIGEEKTNPSAEVVHRFDFETLEFVGIGEETITRDQVNLPEFGEFAADVELKPGMFGKARPPQELLMRTVLKGGEISGEPLKLWSLPRYLKADSDYVEQFSSRTLWTREIEGKSITLRIAPFDGSPVVEHTLRPVEEEGVVSLVIGNLCAVNPLKWEELEDPEELTEPQPGYRDVDFKWFYRLLQSTTVPFSDRLGDEDFPVPVLRKKENVTGVQGCIRGQIAGTVTTE
jgi:hypothetical protein